MITRRLTVQFLTPAFLGGAEQEGRWRTPPFKHLLREWWRVAWAADHGYAGDVAAMRREEALLFGHAWLEGDSYESSGRSIPTAARRSQVRVRLLPATTDARKDAWALGSQVGVAPIPDELSTSYAWFGLVKRKGQPDRMAISATKAEESTRVLELAYPDTASPLVAEALNLVATFGALGSRSRGGWGSLAIKGEGIGHLHAGAVNHYCLPIGKCIERDWASALAADSDTGGAWLWESGQSWGNWADAMTRVAELRKQVRSSLKGQTDLRRALGFAGLGFADKGRMPSPLRWKVAGTPTELRVRAIAMPHRMPGDIIDGKNLLRAWSLVRQTLDGIMERN